MRLHLIGCNVLVRELSDAIVHSPHAVDARYLPAGLHDVGAKGMRERIQQAINEADSLRYDAIVLGYGLCGNGLLDLRSLTTPLVVPRAHDCITLLIGDRRRYRYYFEANPGVYFRSAGWVERTSELEDQMCGLGLSASEKDLITKYGEDSGRYLYQQFTAHHRSYAKLTYVRMTSDAEESFIGQARAEAEERGWRFEEMKGDNSLFRRLLSGDWRDDYLVVPPGHRIVAKYDDDILAAVPFSD